MIQVAIEYSPDPFPREDEHKGVSQGAATVRNLIVKVNFRASRRMLEVIALHSET